MPGVNIPPFPCSATGGIKLPADVVHALFHLAETSPAEAVRRVMELTGAGSKEAQHYVMTLARRR